MLGFQLVVSTTVQVHFVELGNLDKSVQMYHQRNSNQLQCNNDDFSAKMTRNLLTIGFKKL